MKFLRYIAAREKECGAVLAVQLIYSAVCLAAFVYNVASGGGASKITASVSYIFLILLPFAAEYILRFRCPQWYAAAIIIMSLGSFAGEVFDVYVAFPAFDFILHFLNGIILGMFGYMIGIAVTGGRERKSVAFCVACAVVFAAAVSAFWEIYEFFRSMITGMDHEEDVFVNAIRSFTLSGTHEKPFVMEDITKTLIYYNGGTDVCEIKGYLDIGLNDTLWDMTAGTLGGAAVGPLALIRKNGERIFPEKVFPRPGRREFAESSGGQRD